MRNIINNSQEVGAHLDRLNKGEPLEDLCTRCGECCFASVLVEMKKGKNLKITIPELPCRFLARKGFKHYECSIYGERLRKAHWCRDLHLGFLEGTYPIDCPYVKGFNGYDGSVTLPDAQYAVIRPVLKKAVMNNPEIAIAFNPDDYVIFLDL